MSSVSSSSLFLAVFLFAATVQRTSRQLPSAVREGVSVTIILTRRRRWLRETRWLRTRLFVQSTHVLQATASPHRSLPPPWHSVSASVPDFGGVHSDPRVYVLDNNAFSFKHELISRISRAVGVWGTYPPGVSF
ncbi:hypothetical protein BJ322DRAFT_293116 [Thelephora terrestris]|uniref:Secreted protein n=1 Tax=Thelephora terrestris TaxID=56493 RepID=A0A9P6L308_9AGAM|nr:hypothetical protein BJ322DRAFT_293116 [Thelephora terrestris]